MKKLIVLAILLGVLGCMAFADTVSSPGSFTGNQVCSTVAGACAATFQSQTAASGVQGNPNWNDFSKDGSNLNVGYVLTGTNAGAGLNNNFLSNTAGVFGSYLGSAASSNTLATNFNFVREALSVTVTVLYTNSANNTNAGLPANKTIGFYDATCVTQGCALGSLQPILGAGSVNGNIANQFNSQLAGATNLGANPGFANYGFYMTSCDLSAGLSPTCITTFSNSALNQGTTPSELTHQHMALFQNAQNARLFYIGFEDGRAGDSIEAAGDYNDVVFGFSTSAAAAAAPEPATYSIMGLGLAGLGLIRRFRK